MPKKTKIQVFAKIEMFEKCILFNNAKNSQHKPEVKNICEIFERLMNRKEVDVERHHKVLKKMLN